MINKLSTIVFFILAQSILFSQSSALAQTDENWEGSIKSVYLSPVDNELGLPVIRMREPGEPTTQLLLRFDILSPIPHNLRYRIRHCDRHWTPDGLDPAEFFSGPAEGSVDNYQTSFTTLIDYTNYYQTFPVAYGYFIASGNYTIEVFPEGDDDSILLTRRFYVVENAVDIDVTVDRPRGATGHFNTDQELSVAVTPNRNSFLTGQADHYTVVARQNRRGDLTRILTSSGYSGSSILYQWQKQNVFPGGNHFRYFDLSNLRATMYHVQRIEMAGGHIFAFLQPDELRGRKVYTQYNSLNGGMKTNIRDRQNPQIEADYVWVNFSLPIEKPYLDGNIHIVGELTEWKLDDGSRMEWNGRYKAYTKRLLLKQGYYSYQLLFLPVGDSVAQTSRIEGDHFEMPNDYTVLVYYHAPGSRYDRLVGIKITSTV